MTYNLKFYTADDEIASGIYRLAKTEFMFKHRKTTPKDFIEVSALLTFIDRRELRAAGSNVPRFSYSDKLIIAAEETGIKLSSKQSSTGGDATKSSTGSSKSTSAVRKNSGISLSTLPQPVPSGGGSKKNSTGEKYRCKFGGRKDYYGNTLPDIIPDTWPMSSNTILADVFNTSIGVYATEPASLLSNFEYFINTQKFASDCVDKIIGAFGKFTANDGKAMDWFGVKGNSGSPHLTGQAIDLILTPGGGDELVKSFLSLLTSGMINSLGFTHVILEGDGTKWRWIHFSRIPNTNNRRVSVSPRGKDVTDIPDFVYLDPEGIKKLKDDLKFGNAKRIFP